MKKRSRHLAAIAFLLGASNASLATIINVKKTNENGLCYNEVYCDDMEKYLQEKVKPWGIKPVFIDGFKSRCPEHFEYFTDELFSVILKERQPDGYLRSIVSLVPAMADIGTEKCGKLNYDKCYKFIKIAFETGFFPTCKQIENISYGTLDKSIVAILHSSSGFFKYFLNENFCGFTNTRTRISEICKGCHSRMCSQKTKENCDIFWKGAANF